MAAKEDVQIAKSLVGTMVIGTILVVSIAILGRMMAGK